MLVVVAAAICRDGRLLVARRGRPPALAGFWELPGGKVEPDEDEVAALTRECREELGVEIAVTERVGPDVPLPRGWTLRAYAARLNAGEPQPLEHPELRWIDATELADLPWLPTNTALIPHLRELLRPAA